MILLAPAIERSESTFCVMCVMFPARARAWCARFGRAVRPFCRRSSYQLRTTRGSDSNPCRLAYCRGSTCVQTPSGSRNVAIPDSALSPAPEKETGWAASRRRARARSRSVSLRSPPRTRSYGFAPAQPMYRCRPRAVTLRNRRLRAILPARRG